MSKILKYFSLVSCLLAFLGCSNDDDSIYPLKGSYELCSVEANVPIDVNFDGEANTDLTKEIPDFDKGGLSLFDNEDIYSINLLWPELLLNGTSLLQGIPPRYEEGMTVEYVNVSFGYFVSIDKKTGEIKKDKKKVNDDNVYTFNFPDKMRYEASKGEISFTTTQTFLLKEGAKGVILKVRFSYKE